MLSACRLLLLLYFLSPLATAFDAERFRLAEALRASKHLRHDSLHALSRLHLERAFVHSGSLLSLSRFADRWKNTADRLTVGVVGGSVSVGNGCDECARAPNFTKTWTRRFFEAVEELRPGGHPMAYRNGAIPSTGAPFFASCLDYRVPADADLVLLEFAMNGGDMAGVEGVVRGLMARPKPPCILFMDWYQYWPGEFRVKGVTGTGQTTPPWTSHDWFLTATTRISAVAQHYDLPQVNMRAALWAEDMAQTPGLRWEDFGHDWTHPNGLGHAYISQAVAHVFASALEKGGGLSDGGGTAAASGPIAVLARGSLPQRYPPLVPGNVAEGLGRRCSFGPDLTPLVVSHNGWRYDDEDPLKATWSVEVNASGFKSNALVLRTEAYHGGVLAFTKGWDTADAELSCAGGCACEPVLYHAYKDKLRVMTFGRFKFESDVGGQSCDLVLTAKADRDGHKGFKCAASFRYQHGGC